MNKRKYIYIPVAIFLFFCFYLIYYIENQRIKYLKDILVKKESLYQRESKLALQEFKDILFYYNSTSGTLLDRTINVFNTSNRKIELKKIIEDQPKLVFYFKYKNCQVCLEDELNLIAQNRNKIGSHNIIFLSEFKSIREQSVFENKYGVSCYNIGNNKLNLIIEERKAPFYFVLEKGFVVSDLYMPVKLLPDYSETYFDTIVEKYFSKSNSGKYATTLK